MMSGWLVARNRPPFAAYASPGPSGKSVVAGASVRFVLTDATSNEGSAGGCANSTDESSPGKRTLNTWCRMDCSSSPLTPTPGNCSEFSLPPEFRIPVHRLRRLVNGGRRLRHQHLRKQLRLEAVEVLRPLLVVVRAHRQTD